MVLTDDQKALQESARRFARERLLPDYQKREKLGVLSRELVAEMGSLGLLGMDLPEELGGMGADAVTTGLIAEELAYGDFNVSAVPVGISLNAAILIRHAQPEIVREWVPRMTAGRAVVAICLTELARRVARALGLPLVDVPASTVKSIDGLLATLDATLAKAGAAAEERENASGLPQFDYPPMVVFLDEIHLLKKPDTYLNLFEPRERRAVGSEKIALLPRATFIGATTDKGKLPGPFRSRFNIIDLEPYTPTEVAEILRPDFGATPVPLTTLEALARLSRCNPRVARENAKTFATHNRYDPTDYSMDAVGLARLRNEVLKVDADGLGSNDLAYLRALSPGRRGLSNLCQVVQVGADESRTCCS